MYHQRVSPLYCICSIIKSISKNYCIQNPDFKRIFWELLIERVLALRTCFTGWFSAVFRCVQLCSTPLLSSLPGSSVRGILQARILEQVAFSSSMGSSQLRDNGLMSPESPAFAGGFFTVKTTYFININDGFIVLP